LNSPYGVPAAGGCDCADAVAGTAAGAWYCAGAPPLTAVPTRIVPAAASVLLFLVRLAISSATPQSWRGQPKTAASGRRTQAAGGEAQARRPMVNGVKTEMVNEPLMQGHVQPFPRRSKAEIATRQAASLRVTPETVPKEGAGLTPA
jgi:hypothetical protein